MFQVLPHRDLVPSVQEYCRHRQSHRDRSSARHVRGHRNLRLDDPLAVNTAALLLPVHAEESV